MVQQLRRVNMAYPLKRTCKEVTALVVAREDRALDMTDKLALRMHLAICKTCPQFERQILTMRQSFRLWRNYTGTDDSR